MLLKLFFFMNLVIVVNIDFGNSGENCDSDYSGEAADSGEFGDFCEYRDYDDSGENYDAGKTADSGNISYKIRSCGHSNFHFSLNWDGMG